jgi:hypothetical protein
MGLSNVQLLLVVNFLVSCKFDVSRLLISPFQSSLSCGIVAPSFSLHVMMHGGNQIILGFLAAFTYICTSIGKDVIVSGHLAPTNQSHQALGVVRTWEKTRHHVRFVRHVLDLFHSGVLRLLLDLGNAQACVR